MVFTTCKAGKAGRRYGMIVTDLLPAPLTDRRAPAASAQHVLFSREANAVLARLCTWYVSDAPNRTCERGCNDHPNAERPNGYLPATLMHRRKHISKAHLPATAQKTDHRLSEGFPMYVTHYSPVNAMSHSTVQSMLCHTVHASRYGGSAERGHITCSIKLLL